MKKLLLLFLLISACSFGAVDDSYTKVLFHFDNTFTDESGKTWIASGSMVATTTSKFGGYAAFFDGSDDFLITTDTISDFEFGTGSFTVDFWVYMQATPTQYMNVLSTTNSGLQPNYVLWYDNTSGFIGFSTNGLTSNVIEATSTISLNQWHHLAFCQDGPNIRLFIDGYLNVSSVAGQNFVITNPTQFRIGQQFEEYPRYFYGIIDELRISKGIARWTENFIPPTEAYGQQDSSMNGIHFSTFGLINFSGIGRICFGGN